MSIAVSMREALADERLLGSALRGPSWLHWRAMLIAMNGEALTDAEREIFRRFTGRDREPCERVQEALFLIGRRGGKDRAISVLASYLAALTDWSGVLSAGERGVVLCIGADLSQANVQRSYIEGVFDSSPLLSSLVASRTNDALELTNGITIEVRAANFRRLRGMTSVAVIASEAAFWQQTAESSNPDTEIINALKPTLATTGGPLIVITTPYSKRGEVWTMYRQHYGPQGDPLCLVTVAGSRDFNPTLSEKIVDRAMERDAAAAGAEYYARFRDDVAGFITREVIEACVVQGRYELPPVAGVFYVAHCDPSGGAGDSMALCMAHLGERGSIVVDCVRERRSPFSPDEVIKEFSDTLKSYGVPTVHGDHFGGEFPRQRFREHGIEYIPADKPKSAFYVEALPLINSGKVEMLDHPRAVDQFCSLERRTARSGKDSIDHAPGARDDVCNAVAGAVVTASGAEASLWSSQDFLGEGRKPVALPSRCDVVFCVLVADEKQACAAHFALSPYGSTLYLLDLQTSPLYPLFLIGVARTLNEWRDKLHAQGSLLYTTKHLRAEMERLGHDVADAIDVLVAEGDQMLALAAAVHIAAQRVKISEAAYLKADAHPFSFLNGSTRSDSDPTRLAFLAGVALALDPARSLRAA